MIKLFAPYPALHPCGGARPPRKLTHHIKTYGKQTEPHGLSKTEKSKPKAAPLNCPSVLGGREAKPRRGYSLSALHALLALTLKYCTGDNEKKLITNHNMKKEIVPPVLCALARSDGWRLLMG